MTTRLTRRALLRRGTQTALLLAGGAALAACALAPAGTAPASIAGPAPTPRAPDAGFVPDLEIRLRAGPTEADILPGRPTQVWSYQAELLKGDPGSLERIPGSFIEGWKDTVLLMPGERVKLLRFGAHTGMYMAHCHILEHEDMGLMRNIEVVA